MEGARPRSAEICSFFFFSEDGWVCSYVHVRAGVGVCRVPDVCPHHKYEGHKGETDVQADRDRRTRIYVQKICL